MPKIHLSDATTMNDYREALDPAEQMLFDQIVVALKHPASPLTWYHHLGDLIGQLRSIMKARKAANIAHLAVALGLSESLFTRSQRLVKQYPSRQSLAELESAGADWTRLTLAFCIQDKKKRLALLREAGAKKWSIPELREQLYKRFPTNRKGVGGRPRTQRAALSPEGRIRELARLSEEWNHLHSNLPPKTRSTAWRTYARTLSKDDVKKLVQSLEGLSNSLKDGLNALRSIAGSTPVL